MRTVPRDNGSGGRSACIMQKRGWFDANNHAQGVLVDVLAVSQNGNALQKG